MAKSNAKKKAAKPKKPPIGRRIGDRIRTAGLVGADAVRNPRGIPQTAHGAFRRWFRKVWDTRGGGLYTLGYALTFAALELRTFVTELAGMGSASDFIIEQLIEFFIRFGTDSLKNLILALIWPVFVLSWHPPWGVGLFVIAFLLFPKFVKPHVERWLFRDDAQATTGETDQRS